MVLHGTRDQCRYASHFVPGLIDWSFTVHQHKIDLTRLMIANELFQDCMERKPIQLEYIPRVRVNK